jgi:hypothetical protein
MTVMTDPDYGIGEDGNSRGLLVYVTMGMGKTRIGASIIISMWHVREVIIMCAKALQANMMDTIKKLCQMLGVQVLNKVTFISMDAFNVADQLVKTGGLDDKLFIVDEAHNFFRGIINSSGETNMRRIYDMVMIAHNLRIIFLTGTPASKNPFELVPCFNMLAGKEILPSLYEKFYEQYVDLKTMTIKNRDKLANRLLGMVSHITHSKPTSPDDTLVRHPGEEGWFPREETTKYIEIQMGSEQYSRYLLARELEEAESKGGKLYKSSMTITNKPLSLPGADQKGLNTYFVKSRTLSLFCPPSEFASMSVDEMPDECFTEETAPTAWYIANHIMNARRPCLVYSQFVEYGLKPVGRILNKLGYVPFIAVTGGDENSPLNKSGDKSSDKPHTYESVKASDVNNPLSSFNDLYVTAEVNEIKRITSREWPIDDPVSSMWYEPQDDIGDVTYRAGKSKGKNNAAALLNLHHGQRKLFVSELQCLNLLLKSYDEPAVVVYAGSAPGYKMPMLSTLFPNVHFHLIDPSPFGFHGRDEMIHTYNMYFTDELALSWKGKCDIFISDIRIGVTLASDESWSPEFEEQVAKDMAMQDTWTRLIEPKKGAMLKFRPPYIDENTELVIPYVKGKPLWQTWPSRSSTETRLIVVSADATIDALPMDFDVKRYQDACAHHNMVVRPWATFKIVDDSVYSVPGYDRCFDCMNEARAWKMYNDSVILSMNTVNTTSPVTVINSNSTISSVGDKMNELTSLIKQYLNVGINSDHPSFHGMGRYLNASNRLSLIIASKGIDVKFERSRPGLSKQKPVKIVGGVSSAHSSSKMNSSSKAESSSKMAVHSTSPNYYAMLHGEIPTEMRKEIVKAETDPGNMYGKKLKVILISKTGAEGLDLKYLEATHVMERDWYQSRSDQVNSRGSRMGSHDGLPEEDRIVYHYEYISVANPNITTTIEKETIGQQFLARSIEQENLNKQFRELLTEVCLECSVLKYAKCKTCSPDNVALFTKDSAQDLRLPDPCKAYDKKTVTVQIVEFEDKKYYYSKDEDSPLGYIFYTFDNKINAYVPMDESEQIITKLLKLVR